MKEEQATAQQEKCLQNGLNIHFLKILQCLEAPGWLSWLSIQLEFGSGHDPRAVGSSPAIELCNEFGACLRLSLSPSAPLSPACSLSLN